MEAWDTGCKGCTTYRPNDVTGSVLSVSEATETVPGETPDRVADGDESDVVDAIAIGGLARQKAPRIQAILRKIRRDRGELSLEYLREMEEAGARQALLDFKGIGPKSAAFVLMYAAGMDVFPMDTHIFRIFERVGLLTGSESDRKAHKEMEALVPSGRAYAAHMALVRHGREVCHARRPDCALCVLRDICPSADMV